MWFNSFFYLLFCWNLIFGFALQLSISLLQTVVRSHLGNVPHVYDLASNVSFVLQNGHSSVSYSRPFLPNVAEIACIHCKPARPLPKVMHTYDLFTFFSLSLRCIWTSFDCRVFHVLVGFGRFCHGFGWIWFHLCVDGFVGESGQNARTFATAVYSNVCTASVSCDLEMGKWPERDERFATKCQNWYMAAATRYFR